jgi:plasmid stabilization system protein ParE
VDFKIRYSETALAGFTEILAYSWAEFPDTTEQFGSDILACIDSLTRFPYSGRPVPDQKGLRVLIHRPVQIFYEVWVEAGVVEIVAIRHSSRADQKLN